MAKSKSKNKSAGFKLRHDWSVGAIAAEEDERFLEQCFVDSGFLTRLTDPYNTASIIVGRTGIGKSALLFEIKERFHDTSKIIDPEEFSIRYISNSNILSFFEKIGVNLDLAYQMLWKHVLCVELIKLRYGVKTSEQSKSIFGKLRRRFERDTTKQQALDYLEEWGKGDFWQTTEKRVKELTERLEKKLAAELKSEYPGLEFNAGANAAKSLEKKSEILHAGQRVVNNLHMQDLQEVIKILSEEVFDDSGQTYFLIIDDLDKGWAEEQIRFKLVRALIESIKRLRKIQKVKILISMRSDLLEKVFAETRDAGFQEDKYEDYFVRLRWSNDELRDLINQRLNFMVRDKYQPTAEMSVRKLFESKVDGVPLIRHMISRTLRRPRDIIVFVNECIQQASGKSKISAENVRAAEAIYSKKRVDALVQEWLSVYPNMEKHIEFLRGLKNRTYIKEIDFEHIQTHLLSYTNVKEPHDEITKIALNRIASGFDGHRDALDYVSSLLNALYKIGIVGISQPIDNRVTFSEEGLIPFTEEAITIDYRFSVHPIAYRYLSTAIRS